MSDHGTVLNQSALLEPPETPAPVFALRAFKTALFGTPQQSTPEARQKTDVDEKAVQRLPDVKDIELSTKEDTPIRQDMKRLENQKIAPNAAKKPVPLTSPARPAGILLTPGTGTTRRKTVSFGEGVVDNEGKRAGFAEKSGLPKDFPGKFPSPWTPRDVAPDIKRKRNSFTEALYEVSSLKSAQRSEMKGLKVDRSKPITNEVGKPQVLSETEQSPKQRDINQKDTTLDLREPKSQSGRYWKLEYEQYASRTKKEMKRLIKYKQLAKSYAKKKDAEAMDLGEKLREEKEKISRMEEQVSQLAAEIASLQCKDGDQGAEQTEMMRQLTQRTAFALEYKQKVDDFEAALEGGNGEGPRLVGKMYASPGTTARRTEAGLGLTRDQEQAYEVKSLREHLASLQSTLQGVEAKANRLDEEKNSLEKLLAKVKDSHEDYRQKREMEKDCQNQLQERLEIQIQEYEALLSQAKHERYETRKISREFQAKNQSELCRENPTLKADPDHVKKTFGEGYESQKEVGSKERAWYEAVIKDLQNQIQILGSGVDADEQGFAPSEWQKIHRKVVQDLRRAREDASLALLDKEQLRKQLQEARLEIKTLKQMLHHSELTVEIPNVDLWLPDNPRSQTTRVARSRTTSQNYPASTNKNVEKGEKKKWREIPLSELSLNQRHEHEGEDDHSEKLEPEQDHAQSFNLSVPVLPSPETTFISSDAIIDKEHQSRSTTTTPERTRSRRPSSYHNRHKLGSAIKSGSTRVSKSLKQRDARGMENDRMRERKLDVGSEISREQFRSRRGMDPDRAAAAQIRIAERQRIREQNRIGKENIHA